MRNFLVLSAVVAAVFGSASASDGSTATMPGLVHNAKEDRHGSFQLNPAVQRRDFWLADDAGTKRPGIYRADDAGTKRPGIHRADDAGTKRPGVYLVDDAKTKRPEIYLADDAGTKRPEIWLADDAGTKRPEFRRAEASGPKPKRSGLLLAKHQLADRPRDQAAPDLSLT